MGDLMQYLMNFGLGAVFAGVMFVAYRSIVKQMEKMVERYDTICREHNESLIEFRTVLTELVVWLKAKNGHS